MKRSRILVAAVAFFLSITPFIYVGDLLTRPATEPVGPPPDKLHATSLSLASGSIAGWHFQGTPGKGVVLLLHGVRGNRRWMSERAISLRGKGFSGVLIDLPAHGESSGERITFGLRESKGVIVALEWIRQHYPNEKVGVIGVSLGGAALVLGQPSPPPDAVVLEAVYPTIAEATADRLTMRLGGTVGQLLTPLLLLQLPFYIGTTHTSLRPIEVLPKLGSPILIIAGSEDEHTTRTETERLFAAANEPKKLWLVEGARHVDLHAFDKEAYENRVFSFLSRYLTRIDRLEE